MHIIEKNGILFVDFGEDIVYGFKGAERAKMENYVKTVPEAMAKEAAPGWAHVKFNRARYDAFMRPKMLTAEEIEDLGLKLGLEGAPFPEPDDEDDEPNESKVSRDMYKISEQGGSGLFGHATGDMDYGQMRYKDLRALAKERGITLPAHPKGTAIIKLLKKYDADQ